MHNFILSPFSLEELNASISAIVEQAVAKQLSRLEAPQPEQILTRKQAAQLLGVSLPTIHEWTKEGLVIGYRINSRVRYKRSELEQALKQIKAVRNR